MTQRARRRLLQAAAVSVAAGLAPGAWAQGFPSRPVRIVVPFGAGTSSDAIARALADKLAAQLKVSVVVENREGAGGRIGAAAVATAAADGHTLLFATQPPFVVSPLTQQRPAYDAAADFTPIAKIATAPMVLVASAKSPLRSFADMTSYAAVHPGKLDYASAGTGVPSHLFMEQLKRAIGLDVTLVPYRATGQMYTDVVAGHVPLAMLSLGAARPYVQSGELRGLAIGSAARSPLLPQVPTLEEATGRAALRDGVSIWFGLLGPKGLPDSVVARLHAEVTAAAGSPEMASTLATQGAMPATAASASAFAAELAETRKAAAALLTELKLLGTAE